MINALYVETNGVYFNLPNIEAWDIERNAFNCRNGAPAICHPPCKRWGRYWGGGPSASKTFYLGDDSQCFAHSLWYVRTFGGIIEHPEATHAYAYYGLSRPPKSGGWVKADEYGGLTCCVYQGNYGHAAHKATWLYINKIKPIELIWGKPKEEKLKFELSPHSKEKAKELRSHPDYKPVKRLNYEQRMATPLQFRDLLIRMMQNKT